MAFTLLRVQISSFTELELRLKYKENVRAGLNRSQSLLLYGQRFKDEHRLPLQGLHY